MITVEASIRGTVEEVWKRFTLPEHIKNWNNASDDWHTPHAENDLMVGGKFVYRMEAKDGSFGFDFGGVYDLVQPFEKIAYTIADGRKVLIEFTSSGDQVKLVENFEPENTNPEDMQKAGWQSILNNFKRYAESVQS